MRDSHRPDLAGRELPIVYNGRSAEEWYSLYCESLLETARLSQEINRLRAESLRFSSVKQEGEPK